MFTKHSKGKHSPVLLLDLGFVKLSFHAVGSSFRAVHSTCAVALEMNKKESQAANGTSSMTEHSVGIAKAWRYFRTFCTQSLDSFTARARATVTCGTQSLFLPKKSKGLWQLSQKTIHCNRHAHKRTRRNFKIHSNSLHFYASKTLTFHPRNFRSSKTKVFGRHISVTFFFITLQPNTRQVYAHDASHIGRAVRGISSSRTRKAPEEEPANPSSARQPPSQAQPLL